MAHIRMKSFSYGISEKALQVIFTTSRTYTIPSGYRSMDVFLVGGGAGGSDGSYARESVMYIAYTGGKAGSGGRTTTSRQISVNKNTLNITVGNGGQRNANGQNSSLSFGSTTITANGGNRTLSIGGGSGGGANGNRHLRNASQTANAGAGGSDGQDGNPSIVQGSTDIYQYGAVGQGTTTKRFQEASGTLYSGGGGGGGAIGVNNGAGGAGGGGTGGYGNTSDYSNVNGTSGTNNTGGGGGGGWGYYEHTGQGGAGGSGIVIIRLYSNSKRPTITWNNNNTINL